MKNILIFRYAAALLPLLAATLAGCSDWTEPEPLKIELQGPESKDPAAYESYVQGLRNYKSQSHAIVYARHDNAPAVSTSEKDFLRLLPDSLDMVSLRNPDALSAADIEDMPALRRKGTKVLYYIDYDRISSEAGSGVIAALGAYMDGMAGRMGQYGFDGIAVGGTYPEGVDDAGMALHVQAAALLASRLGTLAGGATGKPLLFEGDPLFWAAADRAAFDYFVLPTASAENMLGLQIEVQRAAQAGVGAKKLVLAASVRGSVTDLQNVAQNAVSQTAQMVASDELAGLAVYDIGDDHYVPAGNYLITRGAIQLLNPAPVK